MIFVAASVLLSMGVGLWAVRFYMIEGGLGWLAFGIVFFILGVTLILYGVRVRAKLFDDQ
ncbi:MAG TPA: hypothetical protein VMS56_08840 [Thermoanaerobaculia bacterium]|nr:hypothetical protein [Thermoanaerobaculia bacterium]